MAIFANNKVSQSSAPTTRPSLATTLSAAMLRRRPRFVLPSSPSSPSSPSFFTPLTSLLCQVFEQWEVAPKKAILSSNMIDAGYKARPTPQELSEMGPEFNAVSCFFPSGSAHPDASFSTSYGIRTSRTRPTNPLCSLRSSLERTRITVSCVAPTQRACERFCLSPSRSSLRESSLPCSSTSSTPPRGGTSTLPARVRSFRVHECPLILLFTADPHAKPHFDSGFMNNKADFAPIRWSYKRTREIARRMDGPSSSSSPLQNLTIAAGYRGELTSHHPHFHPASPAAVKDIDIVTAKQLLPNGFSVGIHMRVYLLRSLRASH